MLTRSFALKMTGMAVMMSMISTTAIAATAQSATKTPVADSVLSLIHI